MKQRLIYSLFVLLAAHYSYIVPAACMGFYVNHLIPGMNLWSVSGHALVLCGTYTLFDDRKPALEVMIVLILVMGLLVNQFLAGWPTLGMKNFYQNWTLTILQYVVEPVVAYALLKANDKIAPRIVRGWTPK